MSPDGRKCPSNFSTEQKFGQSQFPSNPAVKMQLQVLVVTALATSVAATPRVAPRIAPRQAPTSPCAIVSASAAAAMAASPKGMLVQE